MKGGASAPREDSSVASDTRVSTTTSTRGGGPYEATVRRHRLASSKLHHLPHVRRRRRPRLSTHFEPTVRTRRGDGRGGRRARGRARVNLWLVLGCRSLKRARL